MKIEVEQKSFVIGWWVGAVGKSAVFITENRKNRDFKVFISKEGGVWLTGVLGQLNKKELGDGIWSEPFQDRRVHWENACGSLTVEVAENGHGRFVLIESGWEDGEGRRGCVYLGIKVGMSGGAWQRCCLWFLSNWGVTGIRHH